MCDRNHELEVVKIVYTTVKVTYIVVKVIIAYLLNFYFVAAE